MVGRVVVWAVALTALTALAARPAPSAADDRELAAVEAELRAELKRLAAETKVAFGDGLRVSQPSAPGHYRGLWPDDWYFPHKVLPELISDVEARRLFAFLTDHIERAPVLPDRIEPDGHLVFQPGAESRPHGKLMPVHLPAAWLRLVRYLHGRTGDTALKERWRGVIDRSVDKLVLRDGLPFVSDVEPQVAFGFYDTVGLQGNELMTSVVLEKGLRHAVPLFGGDLGRKCAAIADSIAARIVRLRSAEGWYLSDTIGCRQFSAWSNGLLYGAGYLPAADRTRIREAIWARRGELALRGQVRHAAEPWRRMNPVWQGRPVGTYMNGGYWAVGTAYALKALYDRDRGFALATLRAMLADLRKTDFAEWTDAEGTRLGARKFLMSAALPLAAVRAILRGGDLLDEF